MGASTNKDIVRRLRYKGPMHLISAATGRGTRELAEAVMNFLASRQPVKPHSADA